MAVERDHQRQRIGADKLNHVLVGNILLPERRQMDFNRVEEVAPLIKIVAVDAVARNRVGDGEHRIALRIQGEGDRCSGGTRQARRLLSTGQRLDIGFNRAPLFRRELTVRRPGKIRQVRQTEATVRTSSEEPPCKESAGQHSSDKNQNGAHAFPILLFLQRCSRCTLLAKRIVAARDGNKAVS